MLKAYQFKLGRVLRRSGTPHFIANLLPRFVFAGWVDEELWLNREFYVDYNSPWDHDPMHDRAVTTVYMGGKSMKL